MTRARSQTRDDGFTLVELIIVVLVIGILASIAVTALVSQQNQAKDAAAQSDLTSAKIALVSYAAANHGEYSTATVADLGSYGFTASPGVTLSIADASDTGEFCVQAVSSMGTSFNITDGSGVGRGACD